MARANQSLPVASKGGNGVNHDELLIVIGLLGALTALILARLAADREEAMGDVCDYNQAGTVRVLTQYADMFGSYPAGLHNGLNAATGTPAAMDGLPLAQEGHMITDIATTRLTLTAAQAQSLTNAGITSIAWDNGYNITTVAEGVVVAQACSATGTSPWNDEGGNPMTFDGVPISDSATGAAGPSWNRGKAGPVVCLWVTPTVDWEFSNGGNQDWTNC